ncbi:MAG: rod shape-determining protein RodA [Nitrospirae bacterium]|nr:rod shape-determining protein RodA [Nitrospirota bacterium]
MIDRRLISNFDWGMFIAALVLSLIGVSTIYSATRPVFDAEQQSFYIRQLYWIGLSVIFFLAVISVDYRQIVRHSFLIYIFGIILLVLVMFIGRKGMGAQRWIPLGFLSFQPSEFFKLFFILAMSRYLAAMGENLGLGMLKISKIAAVFFVLPALLIATQPDLGTALILLFIFVSMLFIAGIRRRLLVIAVIIGIISLPFVGNVFWGGLKGYQKNRIVAFMDPKVDPQGVGYHIKQSKVTIGSGGFTGKGYMKGTQGPLRFLPEKHTDFIFAIFAEEWGFVGSLILFLFYLFIILRGFDTAKKARDLEGAYLAAGITFMFTFYFLINAGMTMGMTPVVGAPLPLMSYGGTALLSNFLSLALIENVRMRRLPNPFN